MKFILFEAYEKCFKELRGILTSSLVLTLYEWTNSFVVYGDAFKNFLGKVQNESGKSIAYT